MKTAEEWAHECYDDNAGQYEDASLSYGQYVALTKRIQRDALESAAKLCREKLALWDDYPGGYIELAGACVGGIEALKPEEP